MGCPICTGLALRIEILSWKICWSLKTVKRWKFVTLVWPDGLRIWSDKYAAPNSIWHRKPLLLLIQLLVLPVIFGESVCVCTCCWPAINRLWPNLGNTIWWEKLAFTINHFGANNWTAVWRHYSALRMHFNSMPRCGQRLTNFWRPNFLHRPNWKFRLW